jgi:uncharacterized membrane protein YhaH (DUF805 family)
MNHISHCYKNYANFNGRATRTEFWLFYLFFYVVSILLAVLGSVIALTLGLFNPPNNNSGALLLTLSCGIPCLIFFLGSLIPLYAAGSRRLHDAGFSGWLQLLLFIPLVHLAVIIMWIVESQHGDNQYGPDPFGRPPLPKY